MTHPGVTTTATQNPARPPSVLLVDRNDGTREALAKVLRHHGFDVETAVDLTKAMDLSRYRAFDLLVSDARIAGPPGGDMARLLKLMYAQGRAAGMFELEMVDEIGVGYDVYVIRPVAGDAMMATVFKAMAGTSAWSAGRGGEA